MDGVPAEVVPAEQGLIDQGEEQRGGSAGRRGGRFIGKASPKDRQAAEYLLLRDRQLRPR